MFKDKILGPVFALSMAVSFCLFAIMYYAPFVISGRLWTFTQSGWPFDHPLGSLYHSWQYCKRPHHDTPAISACGAIQWAGVFPDFSDADDSGNVDHTARNHCRGHDVWRVGYWPYSSQPDLDRPKLSLAPSIRRSNCHAPVNAHGRQHAWNCDHWFIYFKSICF